MAFFHQLLTKMPFSTNCLFLYPSIESARRYIEGDVNIHYKTPVRYELKEPISDAELIHRQEHAKKLYQEERRRKYLQELQDLNNRRHTDNFTPTQKSPISLNRYDDFGSIYDYAPKSPNYPRTVSRALYNFQGQTSRFVENFFFLFLKFLHISSDTHLTFCILSFLRRELNFKKGDIIYIRRKIDENWYEGEIDATIGLLPSNYVEVIIKLSSSLYLSNFLFCSTNQNNTKQIFFLFH